VVERGDQSATDTRYHHQQTPAPRPIIPARTLFSPPSYRRQTTPTPVPRAPYRQIPRVERPSIIVAVWYRFRRTTLYRGPSPNERQ